MDRASRARSREAARGTIEPLIVELASTPRFEIRRRIGTGGMGAVYEAFDRQRDMRIAIKTLLYLDPLALYRFKNEFRALADITHDNLVRLYELVNEGRDWFFTMELVTGLDLLTYVWGHGPGLRAEPSLVYPLHDTLPGDPEARAPAEMPAETATRPRGAMRSPGGLERARACLAQLAAAIDALHRAGKLHRDVKPANILVEPSGRVVLLDFGIAKDLKGEGDHALDTDRVLGTPAFMAPEQVDSEWLTEAADWYAVGGVLFEALTGRVPFTGHPLEVLIAKRERPAPRARDFVPEIPADLDDLCAALLESNPLRRPSGAEILRRCGLTPQTLAPISGDVAVLSVRPNAFVGRETMLATMRGAIDAVKRGQPAIVHVVGPSGMGKTALVRRFLYEIEQHETGAVVLSGRCYERESVAYKGFDALIDALSRYLASLAPSECAALVPRDARALARVFPVLDRVESFANAPRRDVDVTDPHQIRTRAFAALRELFTTLAQRRLLVLSIDDLQWGDADSAALLAEITALPDPPRLLVVVAYRSEDVGVHPWLTAFERSARTSGFPRAGAPLEAFTCRLSVDALEREDAVVLTASLLNSGRGDARVVEIAAESGGSPFFIGELVEHAQSSAGEGVRIRLEDVVERRLRALPPGALRIVELVSVAGHPIARNVIFRIAEIEPRDADAAITSLRRAHLLRASGNRLEPYHDRIREAVVRELDAAKRRGIHASLGEAHVALGETDPDVLYTHFAEAELSDRAAVYAEGAAARAAALLAFDRAAQLYERALALSPAGSPQTQPLRVLLAESLARAGRGAAAAEAFIEAARRESGRAQLDLRRKASAQLLFSGHIDRGVDLVRQVLAQEGMRLASSPLTALLALLLIRLLIVLRGTSYRERPASEVSPKILARIDSCAVVANGLSFVDNIQGRLFQGRAFLLALGAGEPMRLLHALCGEAVFRAAKGWRSLPRAMALLDEARRLAKGESVPDHRGTIEYGQGMVHHITGDWVRAAACFERAESLFTRMDETYFRIELDGAQSYGVVVLVLLGRLNDARAKHTALRREAEDRGDLFLGTNLSIGFSNLCWLFADQPATARTMAAEAMAPWSSSGFHMQHWHELLAMTHIDLYEGEAERAAERMTAKWKLMEQAMLMRIEMVRLLATVLRGLCGLAIAARGQLQTGLATAERDAKTLTRHGATWTAGVGALIGAGVHAARGDDADAIRLLESAVEKLDAASLALFAAVARRRLGQLRGGEEGAKLVADADAWMTGEGIRRPDRIATMLAPGFVKT